MIIANRTSIPNKSAAGIGSLLLKGIGDTIRVSLTDNPVKEVYAAKDILKALDTFLDMNQYETRYGED